MAKREVAYVFDGPAMGAEHGVYVAGQEYRRGDTLGTFGPEDAANVDSLLARGVLRKVSATNKAARESGEEV